MTIFFGTSIPPKQFVFDFDGLVRAPPNASHDERRDLLGAIVVQRASQTQGETTGAR